MSRWPLWVSGTKSKMCSCISDHSYFFSGASITWWHVTHFSTFEFKKTKQTKKKTYFLGDPLYLLLDQGQTWGLSVQQCEFFLHLGEPRILLQQHPKTKCKNDKININWTKPNTRTPAVWTYQLSAAQTASESRHMRNLRSKVEVLGGVPTRSRFTFVSSSCLFAGSAATWSLCFFFLCFTSPGISTHFENGHKKKKSAGKTKTQKNYLK